MSGSTVGAESRQLLAYLAVQPMQCATMAKLRAELPELASTMLRRVHNLIAGGYMAREVRVGEPTFYVFKRATPTQAVRASLKPRKQRRVQAVTPPASASPYVGQVVPPPTHDRGADWPEPYLTDIGVRRDGLQYRDCPSRRGDRLVYCYRRDAR